MIRLLALAALLVGCTETKPPPAREPSTPARVAPTKQPVAKKEQPPRAGVVPAFARRKVRSHQGKCLSTTEPPKLVDCSTTGTWQFLLVRDHVYMLMASAGSCLEFSQDGPVLGACDGAPMVAFGVRAVSAGVHIATGNNCLSGGAGAATVRHCTDDAVQVWSVDVE